MTGAGRGRPAGVVLAALVAVAVLGVAWSGLYSRVGAGRIALLLLVACLPALAALAPRRRGPLVAAAAVAAVLGVLALALRVSPLALPLLDGGAWSALRGLMPDGLASGSESGLPVDPAAKPALVALLDVALAGLAGAAAWQILARRRPVAGLVLVGVGLAYRWTVEPPESGAAAGALALAALVAVLALAAAGDLGAVVRRAGGAAAFGAVTVAVATGLGTGPAQAGDGWWSWRDWEIGAAGEAPSSGLDLRQRYGKLDWPATPRVALTVEADDPYPLRAVSLDDFDGVAFTLSDAGASEALPVVDSRILLPADPLTAGEAPVFQRIELRGARTQVLMSSGRPERISGPAIHGTADRVGDGIRLGEGLVPGDAYTVRTRIPRPTPALLGSAPAPAAVAGEVPEGATTLRPGYWDDEVVVPLWGSGVRVDPARLGPYAEVAELARTVAGDAPTAYAAINRIEAHLRRSYVYDEAPPYPTSLPDDWPGGMPETRPPLVDFLFGSRRGFCQQFAGAMAVMARSLGIPARVAVGYTGGRYDSGTDRWVVLDRDAHSWVEVWFPEIGWIPFDPTPGRSAPNPASVSSPDYAPTPIDIDLGGIADSAVDPAGPAADPAPAGDPAPVPDAAPAAGPAPGDGGPRWPWLAAAAVLVAALLAPVARALRRLRRRRRGDERARVAAAAADLEAALAPFGWAPPRSAAPSERAAAIRAATGMDVSGLYRRAALARYAPDAPAPGAAAAAWRESSRLRRAARRRAGPAARLRAALGLPWRRRATVDP